MIFCVFQLLSLRKDVGRVLNQEGSVAAWEEEGFGECVEAVHHHGSVGCGEDNLFIVGGNGGESALAGAVIGDEGRLFGDGVFV